MHGPFLQNRLLLVVSCSCLLRQNVLGSSVSSGDDSGSCDTEPPAEPHCKAAFTQLQMKRKEQRPGEGTNLLKAHSQPKGQFRTARAQANFGLAHREPETQDSAVHVVYTASSHVFNATLRSMLSVGLQNTDPNLVIHLVIPPEDEGHAEQLKKCFLQRIGASELQGGKPDVKITKMWELPFKVDFRDNPPLQKSPMASQGRLGLQEYLPEVGRVVYLDTDTLALTDVSKLYGTDMKNHSLAAAMDIHTIVEWYNVNNLRAHVAGNLVLFNSGVMLMDLNRWRQEGIFASMCELVTEIPGSTREDQLLINLEYQGWAHEGRRGGFTKLNDEWNVFCGVQKDYGIISYAEPCADCILHFVGDGKPWNQHGTDHDKFFDLYRPHWTRGGDPRGDDCTGFEL